MTRQALETHSPSQEIRPRSWLPFWRPLFGSYLSRTLRARERSRERKRKKLDGDSTGGIAELLFEILGQPWRVLETVRLQDFGLHMGTTQGVTRIFIERMNHYII